MFRLTASAKFRSVKSLVCLDSSHSQTTITFQPNASSAATSCASLSLLRRIFSCQNSTFDRGILNLSHPGCPCQKHPFMNITVWYLLSTMSGHPGSFLECNEYLNPSECSHLRTTISGRVSFPLIRDIQLCRCSLVIVSGIALYSYTNILKSSLNRNFRKINLADDIILSHTYRKASVFPLQAFERYMPKHILFPMIRVLDLIQDSKDRERIWLRKSPAENILQGFGVVSGRIELPTHGFSVHCSTI